MPRLRRPGRPRRRRWRAGSGAGFRRGGDRDGGRIDRDRHEPAASDPQGVRQLAESIALGRVGQPDDIAGTVAFLASNDARWVTGQVLDASGGLRL